MAAPALCPRTVLIASDSHLVRWALARALETEGFDVRTAATRDDLRRQIEAEPIDLIVASARIERQSVVDLLASLDPHRPPLIVLACGEEEAATVTALCPHAEIIDDPMSVTAVVGLAARRIPRSFVSSA